MLLYKYRSLQNFKYFVDIVFKNRIFAASYSDMNDPMEGYFKYNPDDSSADVINRIKSKKLNIKICSFSRNNNNHLMWSNYADGHRGVAIGVKIDCNKYDVHHVNYDGISHFNICKTNSDLKTAKNILCYKSTQWKYEEESRIFVYNKSGFVNVKIIEILLGTRMVIEDKEFIRKLIFKLNPEITVRDSEIMNII